MILLNADNFLYQEADGKTFLLAGLGIIVALLAVALVVLLIRACFSIERQSGKSAHSLLKTIMIAIAPSIFTILTLLEIETNIPFSLFIAIGVVMFLITAIWNIKSFGPAKGALFSIMHGLFGALASLGVGMLVFVGIFLVLAFFFGGSTSPSGSTSGSTPTMIRDVNNGMTYHVVKGTNGELYVEDNGRSCILRASDYSGRFFDDNGNEYVTT